MDGHAVTAIHLYQPDTEEWVKVGDLPTPRWRCTCAMITDREMFIAGGSDDKGMRMKSVDIAPVIN
jgi:N-acetylneuraminic acid mutarotase